MGLGAPKRRSKLSHDPNNTTWTRDISTFGHKILSKQGWRPGTFLGAENAPHASHFSSANASHIRVMLREDNLGLGAKIGGGSAETFGLSMLSGLLGRLNGDETLQKNHEAKQAAEAKAALARRYGFLNFVYGGILSGTAMVNSEAVKPVVAAVKEARTPSNNKRKVSPDESEMSEETVKSKKKRKLEKPAGFSSKAHEKASNKEKSSRRKFEHKAATFASEQADTPSLACRNKEKEKVGTHEEKAERKTEKAAMQSKYDSSDGEKASLKDEKRARKEERRKRREEKRRKKAEKEASAQASATASAVKSEAERSGTSTPAFMGGRQAVRHRYIMQKRMAAGNAQALREIFMLQPQVA